MSKAKETDSTVVPGVDIPEYVAENYRALVADENRSVTFKSIAKDADDSGDKSLAAWARQQAAKKGDDVTPTNATPDIEAVRRSADEAALAAASEDHPKGVDETGQVDATDTPGTTPPTGLPVDYNVHTIPELNDLLDKREIDRTGLSLKGDLVAALELADEQGEK